MSHKNVEVRIIFVHERARERASRREVKIAM